MSDFQENNFVSRPDLNYMFFKLMVKKFKKDKLVKKGEAIYHTNKLNPKMIRFWSQDPKFLSSKKIYLVK